MSVDFANLFYGSPNSQEARTRARAAFDKTHRWFVASKLISEDYPVRLEFVTRGQQQFTYGTNTQSGEAHGYQMLDPKSPWKGTYGCTIGVVDDYLDPDRNFYAIEHIIAHEFVHVEQTYRGDLTAIEPGSFYCNWKGRPLEYSFRGSERNAPWEKEAYSRMYEIAEAVAENRPEKKQPVATYSTVMSTIDGMAMLFKELFR